MVNSKSQELLSDKYTSYKKFYKSPNNELFLLCSRGFYYKSIDDGKTWIKFYPFLYSQYQVFENANEFKVINFFRTTSNLDSLSYFEQKGQGYGLLKPQTYHHSLPSIVDMTINNNGRGLMLVDNDGEFHPKIYPLVTEDFGNTWHSTTWSSGQNWTEEAFRIITVPNSNYFVTRTQLTLLYQFFSELGTESFLNSCAQIGISSGRQTKPSN